MRHRSACSSTLRRDAMADAHATRPERMSGEGPPRGANYAPPAGSAVASPEAARVGVHFDRTLLLAVPATLFMLLLFIYPFLYGLALSFTPPKGDWLANYRMFFSSDHLWPTIWTTLRLALPATLINVGIALP